MSLGKKLFHQNPADSGDASSAQGLVLHLDANDEDSIESGGANTGAGSGTWFDIANHDLNVPLVDKASNLQLHLNASDTTSYGGSGTTWTDISGNGRNGTITDPVFESGLAGGLDFNSASGTSGDKVEVTHNAIFNQSTSITFELWVKRDSTSEGNIFFKGASGGGYFFTYNTTNGYYFYSYATSGGIFSGTGGLSTGVFEHVVLTIDSSGNKLLYVNGTASSNTLSGSVATTNLTDTGKLFFGGYYPYAAHTGLDGKIGIVRIYNTTLTASEVAQNFRAGNFLSYSSTYSTDLDMNLDAANYTSGTWDDSVTGNSATVTDALFDKELGNFFTFDGATSAGDRIEFPHDATLNQGADISWEVWVKRDDTGIGVILNKGTASSGAFQYFFYYNSAYGYLWYSYAQGGGIYSGNAATTVGVWEHVVFTNDSSGNGKMYVNGELTTSSTLGTRGTPTASVTNTDALNIGGYDALNGNNGHDGEIGVVRFYDTALSSAQVAQNYLATKNDYPNGHNATINGPTFTTNGSSPNEKYFNFDGSNDTMTIPHNTIFDFATPTTMELWLNRDTTNRDFIIDKSQSGGWQLEYNGSSYVFQLEVSGGLLDVRQGVSGTGSWEHIVVTLDSSLTGKLYINGVLEDTDSTSGTVSTNTNSITIGKYSLASGYDFDGKIAMIRFHAKELSSTEVTANYNATKATFGIS